MTEAKKIFNRKYTFPRVLFFCMLCAFFLVICSPMFKEFLKPWRDILLGAIATIAVFGITIFFARWEGLPLKDIGVLPHKKTLNKMLIGFLIGLLIAGIHVALVVSLSKVRLEPVKIISYDSLPLMLLLYLVLAGREELSFRGYPLRSLSCTLGAWKAQAIIVVIFALEHVAGGYSWTQALLGAATGAILFGIAALKTNGIALPIGLHAAWNFGQWCLGFKNEPGIFKATIAKGFETENEKTTLICYLVVMGFSIMGFYIYRPAHTLKKV
jgi:membrane protease YdiL (CAAX protease family)